MEPVPTPYDNEVTMLYAWAQYWGFPRRLVIVRRRNPDDVAAFGDVAYDRLSDIVHRLEEGTEEGEDLVSIFTTINDSNRDITPDDIAMIHFSLWHESTDPKFLLNDINSFYNELEDTPGKKLNDVPTLELFYRAWVDEFSRDARNDAVQFDIIKKAQNQLDRIAKGKQTILTGPISINRAAASFHPTIQGNPVTADNGYEIFDTAILSRYVPFVQYNTKEGKRIYKVYHGDNPDLEPNYINTIVRETALMEPNTIVLVLWLGHERDIMELAPRDSFRVTVYDLGANTINIEAPQTGTMNETVASDRIIDALPLIDLGEGKETSVKGDFVVWNAEVSEISLLHMILLDPLFNIYLYVEESSRAFAYKRYLNIHYRSLLIDVKEGITPTSDPYIANSAAVSFRLVPHTAVNDEAAQIMTSTGKVMKRTMPAGSKALYVNIYDARSRRFIEEFALVFRLLIQFYMTKWEEIEDMYYGILPESINLRSILTGHQRGTDPNAVTQVVRKKILGRTEDARIRRLQMTAPDLFVLNYARRCQSEKQPELIAPDAIAAKEKETFTFRGETYHRQVMPFPPNDPKYYFYCPGKEDPFPQVKINRSLENRDQYPYIPCCGKTDQISNPNSNYYKYAQGQVPATHAGAKAETKIKTDKILSIYSHGYLPTSVEELLRNYTPNHGDMIRYGIPVSPNSLLHCVSMAVDDPQYNLYGQGQEEERENYIVALREHIARVVHPGLLRQELYDLTEDAVTRLLGDVSVFFDPALFYRAVEEVYHINIFVFSHEEGSLGMMELPRFNAFHTQPVRLDRPTMVIMRDWGSESDALLYPHCELVVDLDTETNTITKLFGDDMTQLCFQAMIRTAPTLTWDANLDARRNLYYILDHVSVFEALTPVAQYIDGLGKMRAITFEFIRKGTHKMTVFVMPSQPLNLPTTEEIFRVDDTVVVSLLGKPTRTSLDSSGNVDGLWFQILDIESGIYIPIVPVKKFKDVKPGARNPMQKGKVTISSRLKKLQRTLSFVVQIVKWTYELAKMVKLISPESFVEEFLIENQDEVVDSAEFYDLRRLPRHLPAVSTPKAGLAALAKKAPTLIQGGRIVMYSSEFTAKILDLLRIYERERAGIPPTPARVISDYYYDEDDFAVQENVSIFYGEKRLDEWYVGIQKQKQVVILERITPSMIATLRPYLIKMDPEGKIFIVQNVERGEKNRALAVSNEWFRDKINSGPHTEAWEGEPFVHVIYGINQSGKLFVMTDMTGGSLIYASLLYYGSPDDGGASHYAAMLELL